MELNHETKALLKRINKQGRENIAAALGLKLLICIGFFVVWWLLRSYSVDFCLRTLTEEAQEVQGNIYQQVTFAQDHLEMLGDIIEGEDELASEHVVKILQSDLDMVSRLGIVLPDDQILQSDGTLAQPVNGITFDALAKKGSFITNVEADNLEPDQSVLFINVPIEGEGGIRGILFGVINPQDLSDYFEVDIFDGHADIFIVDAQNMEFIMDTLHGQAQSADALQGHKIKNGYSEEQIAHDFANAQGGVTAYFSRSLDEYLYTAYEPVKVNDWFVMLSVPESIVFKEAAYIEKILLLLGIYEAVILIAYFFWDVVHTRKEMRAKEKMATVDLLTNLKNRNAYEEIFAEYALHFPACLSCVYADANGLHELNNSQGHAAGDRMLQTVADAFVASFGKEHVYRIGGDEFLVFAEMDLDSASKKAFAAKEKTQEAGYHVSVGVASGGEDIDAVVKAAEQKMYADKKRYYMEHGDRRKMR